MTDNPIEAANQAELEAECFKLRNMLRVVRANAFNLDDNLSAMTRERDSWRRWCKLFCTATILFGLWILVSPLRAQDDLPRMTTWKASVAALGVANTLDIASSYGRPGFERNPIYGDTVSNRDVLIKVGGTVGLVLLQRHLIRKYPHHKLAKLFAIGNFAGAGYVGYVAGQNVRRWK